VITGWRSLQSILMPPTGRGELLWPIIIRAYLPLTLGNHSVTPYTRIGLDRWSNWDWQDDIEREGHDFNRVGLFYGYDFQNGLSVSLEYAFEWQDHDEGDSDKFHYAGVGVNYSF
ncbi:OmpG family monomeric porin, partial [Shigella sonnei]|uniref:OmpG family monomeric porin n=1 Tax=Shigella sonnei TaxID=624 RepID=UPI0020931C07